MEETLIANSGIQFFTFTLKINTQNRYKLWFHEWYDTSHGKWHLDPVYELRTDNGIAYFNKTELYKKGYINAFLNDIDISDLQNDGIFPLQIDDGLCTGVTGQIFSISFTDRDCKLSSFEDKWLPVPYFLSRASGKFKFGPLNWSRFKMHLDSEERGVKTYDIILAFDTRTKEHQDEYNECPVFTDKFKTDLDFAVCSNQFLLMDYCSSGQKWSYIDEYLFSIVHPELKRVSQIKGENVRKMSYIATYSLLINYIAENNLFPYIKLFKDYDVVNQDVDMVIDIGNSKTTALLIEDNTNFNQVRMLEMIDYSNIISHTADGLKITTYQEPFDMRLAFRKVDFGQFGIHDSLQFVYPSLIRLGQEANYIIHQVDNGNDGQQGLSTYSSPKRYLWDWKPSVEEWRFATLKNENKDIVLNVKGITNQLTSDGKIDSNGLGGKSYYYSRQSLMTFSFLEILSQAKNQINSSSYRSRKTGFGRIGVARKIKRIIITCPTAMSQIERKALIECAKNAVVLLDNFENTNKLSEKKVPSIEVIPSSTIAKNGDAVWHYDEATCAQLVYMYGEVGHKYKGCCSEFFYLYGKTRNEEKQASLVVGSLDIGAGTSDLMISKYTYEKGDITTITPEPLFYDSYYYAGDDMLMSLIKTVMLFDEDLSAFRNKLKDLTSREYRQKIKDFFGPDYNGQSLSDRLLRKDFNMQYSIPLMHYFLDLLNKDSKDCVVKYNDVFHEIAPNTSTIAGFRERTGIDITDLEWYFDKERIEAVVRNAFEPLLKKIATIFYSYACDIVLLSGRPASLSAVRDVFLKYFAVSPNRLIVLNNHFVGDWYPFSKNTGYITNPKTIVAMGGVIAHYASELSNLNKFTINLEKLKHNLKSTIKFIECSREEQPIEYFLTADKHVGELTISSIPENLKVRQIGIDSYPSRTLYVIDFNRFKMVEKIRRKKLQEVGGMLSDAQVQTIVNENIDALKKRMPFKLRITREPDNLEELSISSILDKNENEVHESELEIHIQSLGADDKYWLDTGAFDF